MAAIRFEVEIDELTNSQLDEAQDAFIKMLNENPVLGKIVMVNEEFTVKKTKNNLTTAHRPVPHKRKVCASNRVVKSKIID